MEIISIGSMNEQVNVPSDARVIAKDVSVICLPFDSRYVSMTMNPIACGVLGTAVTWIVDHGQPDAISSKALKLGAQFGPICLYVTVACANAALAVKRIANSVFIWFSLSCPTGLVAYS